MNYHDQIIELFLRNLGFYEQYFGFSITKTKKGIYTPSSEIDIIVEGLESQALIEVKSNNNQMGKFLHKQYREYRRYNPDASIHLLTGTKNQSLDINNLRIQQFYPATLE